VISRDVAAEAEVFRLERDGAADLARTTATLEGALGRRPSIEEISDAVVRGFERVLGARLDAGGLTPAELGAARTFAAEHRILEAPRG
jgi:lipoate-protein ligase A